MTERRLQNHILPTLLILLALFYSQTDAETLQSKTFEQRISSSLDDAEEYGASGQVNLTSKDLDFGGQYQPIIGLHYGSIDLPKGSIIHSAYIQFSSSEDSNSPIEMIISGDASVNSASFSSVPYNISNRIKTLIKIQWSLPRWSRINSGSIAQRTPDISSIIQEIIDKPNWKNGNALSFILNSFSRSRISRSAWSTEGRYSQSPKLVINYKTKPIDIVPPVMTLLGDNPLEMTEESTFIDPGATAQDGIDGDLTDDIQRYSTVDISTAGTYLIRYSVEDTAGNSASISRNVLIKKAVDKSPPKITLLGDNPLIIDEGALFIDPGATAQDIVDGELSSAIQTFSTVTSNIAGNYKVVYTVNDTSGNKAEEVRDVVVKVVDVIPPIMSILGDNPLVMTIGDTYVEPGVIAQDNVDGNLSATIRHESSIDVSVPGNYQITYTVSDSSGNSVSEIRSVILRPADSIPPKLTIMGNNTLYLSLDSVFNDQSAIAIDNIDGDVSARIQSNSNVDTGTLGNYEVIYSVDDAAGNNATATRNVVVRTTNVSGKYEQRILSGLDDAEESITDGLEEINLSSSDLEIGYDKDSKQTVGLRYTSVDLPPGAIVLKAYIQFVVDEISNDDIQIHISGEASSNSDPFAETPKNISGRIQTNSSEIWEPSEWLKRYDESIVQRTPDISKIIQEIINDSSWVSGNALSILLNTVSDPKVKRTSISYDGDPNRAPKLVIEYSTISPTTIPPELKLLGDNPLKLIVGDNFIDPGAEAIDELDGNITSVIQSISNVDTSTAGNYTVIYSVSDSDGNNVAINRLLQIIPIERVPPVISLNGGDTLRVRFADTFVDPGATAQDLSDGDITLSIQTNSTVDTLIAGDYEVIYSVTDSDGNNASVIRNVIVEPEDTIPPELNLIGDESVTIRVGDDFDDPGAFAEDDIDGDITNSILISSNVDTSKIGDYEVIYSVSDAAGNNTSIRRDVIVEPADSTPPVITLIGDEEITIKIGDDFDDPGATASDDVDGNITSEITVRSDVDVTEVGNYEIKYSVTDSAGNKSSIRRYVRVNEVVVSGCLGGSSLIRTGHIKRSSQDHETLGDLEAFTYINPDNQFAIVDDTEHLLYTLDLDTKEVEDIIDDREFGTYTQSNPNPDTLSTTCRYNDSGDRLGFCDPEAVAYDESNDELFVFTGNHPGELTTFKLSRSNTSQDFSVSGWKRLLLEYTSAIFIDGQFYVTIRDPSSREGQLFRYNWNSSSISNLTLSFSSQVQDLAYENGILWAVLSTGKLYRIRFSDKQILNSFNLKDHGIRDARGIEVVDCKLYVGDGYDYGSVELKHAIHVFSTQ